MPIKKKPADHRVHPQQNFNHSDKIDIFRIRQKFSKISFNTLNSSNFCLRVILSSIHGISTIYDSD